MTVGTTRKSHLRVGGSDWELDLDQDFSDWTIAGTIVTPGTAVAGQSFIDKLFVSAERQIDVGRLLYGTNSKALRDQDLGFAFAIIDALGAQPAMWDGGPAIFQGLPEDAPATDAIVHTFAALPSGVWATGVAVPFALSAAVATVALPEFSSNSRIWIVLDTKSEPLATSRNISIVQSGAAVQTAFAVPSIKGVSAATFASAPARGTIGATLAGAHTVSGYVLIGTDYEVPA